MNQAINAVGQKYRGFLVTKYLPLKELQSTLIELVHEDSGGRIIHIANDDPENLFALSFQTLPNCSNGVAHVLEHIVLCGSEKFPIKDPFFAMTRRSLNTYMNALTGQDFTVYPASSQVEKDFYNLFEVYLDAVFHPQLKHLSFLQEGHRLCFSTQGQLNSPLQIQGVVYNEMKGAMSSPDDRLSFHLFKHLMPDLPYAYNSGGDPKEIPTLTYEDLCEFHRTFYHPSRCLFFFYGNLPLAKHLDFLLNHSIFSVEKVPLLSPLEPQKRFNAPWHVEEKYGIAPDEDPAKKTIVALGFLTVPISDQMHLLALSLLDSLLTDMDVSPLKFALLQSKLCTCVESTIDTEMSEAPWILICKGCEENSAEKIVKLVRASLADLCAKGFDPEAIAASLHQLEFERTEIGGDNVPFGLTLFFRSALPKQHGAEPDSALLIHSLFQDLRKHLADPSFLTDLLRRYLLDNPHAIYLTMAPSTTLSGQEAEEEKQLLKSLKSKLSQNQLQGIVEQEKELADYQEKIEHQSLECLPKLTLQDVPPHAKDYPLASKQQPLPLFHHACFTNRIIYSDLIFDLPRIDLKDLPLLSLFTRFLTEVGSGGRTYADNLKLQQAIVGEMTSSIGLFVSHDDPNGCQSTFAVRAKALERNGEPLLKLLSDTVTSPNFDDADRLQELLLEHATDLENRLSQDAMSFAILLASSSLSQSAALAQQLQGLPYLCSIVELAKSSSASSLIKKLKHLGNNILSTSSPSLVLACADSEEQMLAPHLSGLKASLPQKISKSTLSTIPILSTPSQGRIIPSPVAFTVFAFKTVSYQDEESPALMVARDLLENVVLHKEIREKGGAYGSGASYSPSTGQFSLYAYRDTHLFRTYQAFLQAIDCIASAKFSERELIEAKLGILQDLDAPLPPRLRAVSAYNWMRTHRTYERRDAFRRSILDVSSQEVAAAVKKHLAAQQANGIFVTFAGEDLLKKEAKLLPFAFEILPVRTI